MSAAKVCTYVAHADMLPVDRRVEARVLRRQVVSAPAFKLDQNLAARFGEESQRLVLCSRFLALWLAQVIQPRLTSAKPEAIDQMLARVRRR